MTRFATVAILWLWSVSLFAAGPESAVVRISSHGGSGTVIEANGRECIILSAAHMFSGRDREKKVAFDAVMPSSAETIRITSRVVAVDEDSDLALLHISTAKPPAFVCPVAPPDIAVGVCLSVGYDDMRIPPQVVDTHILRTDGDYTFTREKPWHGRSGGALIDKATGKLVGVVSGYTGEPRSLRGEGVYASHRSVLRFLRGIRFRDEPVTFYQQQPPQQQFQFQLQLQPQHNHRPPPCRPPPCGT